MSHTDALQGRLPPAGRYQILEGPVVDQSAFHVLLQRVGDTGLRLLSVTQSTPTCEL